MKRQIPGRLLASSLALYVFAASLYSPESLIYALTATGGVPALMCMYTLAALACATLLDTTVNDVLPSHWCWACGIQYRQGLWMMLAVTYAGLVFASMREPWGWWLASYYAICAAHCVSVAYIDLWQEHQDRQRNRRAGDREASHA